MYKPAHASNRHLYVSVLSAGNQVLTYFFVLCLCSFILLFFCMAEGQPCTQTGFSVRAELSPPKNNFRIT